MPMGKSVLHQTEEMYLIESVVFSISKDYSKKKKYLTKNFNLKFYYKVYFIDLHTFRCNNPHR